MKTDNKQTKLEAFIKNLMPEATDVERKEAKERFSSYLKLIQEIQQRIDSEKDTTT